MEVIVKSEKKDSCSDYFHRILGKLDHEIEQKQLYKQERLKLFGSSEGKKAAVTNSETIKEKQNLTVGGVTLSPPTRSRRS